MESERKNLKLRDDICEWLEQVLQSMYDAEKQLAEGFKAANVDAMKKAMLKSCDTLQDGRACIWSRMNVVDRALANRKDSIEPKWEKIFSAHQQEARDIVKVMQRPGMQTLSGDWDEESEYQYILPEAGYEK
ncbi:hypothetical protein R1sor_025702 [Riccia sorocarpa]|uniref:Uncharacterized protein n=1 Tax=Riccia sorocarpa TaxID=122646 RepID=A0ABD3GF04_9MARC